MLPWSNLSYPRNSKTNPNPKNNSIGWQVHENHTFTNHNYFQVWGSGEEQWTAASAGISPDLFAKSQRGNLDLGKD